MTKVRVRERDREVELSNTYELVVWIRKQFVEQQMTGKVVIHENDREWEPSRQGRLKYYLHPIAFTDSILRDWQIFKQDIRKHSGSHRHQGGLVIFCLEGRGYTVMEGVRYDWKAGDLLLLPYKPDGVEHQHFNLEEGKPCKWIAFVYCSFRDYGASDLTQGENSADYSPR